MNDFFEFYCPVKIISGNKSLENIPFELKRLTAQRPLVITDQGVVGAGLIKHLKNALKESDLAPAGIYDNVPADSSLKTVHELRDIYSTNNCDSIIAVGGGSVMDTAKGLNIIVSEGVDDIRSMAGSGILAHPLKPLIAIPTTAGTGSEVTLVAVISDEEKERKLLFVSPFLLPNVAVIDTRMTLTLPPLISAATAMDALTHSIEAFTCLSKNPLSDAYAAAAIKLVCKNIEPLLQKPKDKKRRLALANAATMAGIAFSNSMVGMVHTLGHSVGSVCHLAHGMAMSILLPHVLDYNLKNASKKYHDTLAELLLPLAGPEVYAKTEPDLRAAAVIQKIRELKDELFSLVQLPRTLEETHRVTERDLETIAKASMGDGSTIYNPVEIDLADALSVLKKAYDSN